MTTATPLPRRLRWRLEAALLAALMHLCRALGPVRASNLGGALARRLGPLLPVQEVAERNLARALPDLPPAERRATLRAMWDNLGRVAAEYPHLATLGPTAAGPGWEVVGLEQFRELAGRGSPLILVSAHLGNWEVLGLAARAAGLAIARVYRAIENPHLDTLVARMRDNGAPLIPKGARGAREAMALLQAGGALGLLLDQKMNDGIEARFFGRPAMTAPAAAQLALRFRCPLVPVRCERLGPARFRLTVEPPLPLPPEPEAGAERAAARAEAVRALTQAITDRIETWVRARPAEWLWLHRRWKENRDG